MARLALAAILLVSVVPTVSRWLESGAQRLPGVVLAMCTVDGLGMKPASLLSDPGKAPMPAGDSMPDGACAYCPLLATLAPLVFAALAILLPPVRRALLPPAARPASHAPPRLRGRGARGPPILA